MIECEGLTKCYRDLVAIADVTFSVPQGEIVGLLGPNGAGKTTTMRILAGFLPATRGVARVAGFDLGEQGLEVKRRIGYLPEIPPLYPDLTVGEYLAFVARLKGLRGRRQRAELERASERTGLADVLGRLIRNLSRGFRQRAGLAQALLGNPEVLILDEPTAGLDPRQIGEVRALIRELRGAHTVLLSTHVLQEVTALCERVIILDRGRVVADDLIDELRSSRGQDGRERSLEEVFLALTEH